MILIYCSKINARIAYTVRFIFTDILKVQCILTTNKEEFTEYTGPKINYSFEDFDAITLLPNTLMSQKGLSAIDVEVSWVGNIPVLFHECADVSLPFDPFAATFYMISRYEEYISAEKDQHGRFMGTSSLAYKHNFLEIPVVDHWALMLRAVIEKHYPAYRFTEKKYKYIPTLDVDIAYAYLGRNFFRTCGAALKSIVDIRENFRRIHAILGTITDPYDTYDLIKAMHAEHNLSPIWFFQTGNFGKYDKNINPQHPLMQNLIKNIYHNYTVGIHPSYQSDSESVKVKSELNTLEAITGRKVTKSRQHFLRVALPKTYQTLDKCGINEDYSMGYADLPGFRAGTCTPFRFYDLSIEKETQLYIVPLCVMDGTLNQYLGLDAAHAVLKVKELAQQVKNVGGTMVTLWHNQSFCETHEWKGWQAVYPEILAAIM
jgi:hypothetical protein